jgi:hypothetical protein
MKNISLIHIGFHKTASTYLQLKYFKNIDNLQRINDDFKEKDLDKWFFENFININPYEFDRDEFLSEFENELTSIYSLNHESNLLISDENLSGNIYLGVDSKELMNRLYETFGKVKILIIIRNQIDFILSAYSNYILHGGIKTLKHWITSIETHNGLILEKIKYSYLVENYQELFGKENIEVIPYELLWDKNFGINRYIENTLNITVNSSVEKKYNTMKGRSLLLNEIFAFLNRFRINGFLIHKLIKFISILDKSEKNNDRIKVKKVISKYINIFNEDNEKLFSLIDKLMPKSYKIKG